MKIINGHKLRLVHNPPSDDDKGTRVMAIHSGLSVTVCGHLVRLERDEKRKRAVVVVERINGHVVTGLEQSAVKVAADLLVMRAQRFLGIQWTIVGWTQTIQSPARTA